MAAEKSTGTWVRWALGLMLPGFIAFAVFTTLFIIDQRQLNAKTATILDGLVPSVTNLDQRTYDLGILLQNNQLTLTQALNDHVKDELAKENAALAKENDRLKSVGGSVGVGR